MVTGAAFIAATHRPARQVLTATASTSLEGSLRGGEAGNWNPERTATDIVQSDPVAEFDARGLSAMLSANSEFDVPSRFATEIARDFH